MGKIKIAVIFILVIIAFGAGVYFRDGATKIFNEFNKQLKDFQKSEIGQTISQVGKEMLVPSPLNVGGINNKVVLLKSKIITETNLQRQQTKNLPALKENLKLNEAASAKANDMFSKQYFEHNSPSGVTAAQLVQNHGYDFIVAGENLILGNFQSEQEVVQDWMNSPGHRANILNNRYTEIGVAVVKGIYEGENVWIGVQEFGLPLSSCMQPDVSLKNLIDSNKVQLDTLSQEINSKKIQLDSANSNSATYSTMVNDYNLLVNQYNSLAETTKNIVANYNQQVNYFNICVTGK